MRRRGWPGPGLRLALPLILLAGRAVPASAAVLAPPPPLRAQTAGLGAWLSAAREGLSTAASVDDAALEAGGVASILSVYLDQYEPLESWYGPGGPHGVEPVASAVARGEARFHAVLSARSAPAIRTGIAALLATLDTVAALAAAARVPTVVDPGPVPAAAPAVGPALETRRARTPEIGGVLAMLRVAESRFAVGDAPGALAQVEQVYLQAIEELEPRLPGPVAREIETVIHLRLRPQLARAAEPEAVTASFAALGASLAAADAALAGGTSFWFGAVNAFVIIAREGLEAVLLIGAILAYLAGSRAPRRESRRVLAGAGLGLVGTFATWLGARTFLPVSGAGRELMEGVTALVAVGVLLWVSHWLFQKTYLHDWRAYLRSKVGDAVTSGSAFAMAGLAFAAVYREGFETVLFYQALLYDASPAAVLAGFLPGAALIGGLGFAVLRIGVQLPLRMLFPLTNAILLYLAFVFLGKGIYNLQEAGVFAPRPIGWLPDQDLLRQVFGFYPLAETLLAQAAFLSLLAATWLIYGRRRRTLAAAAGRMPEPLRQARAARAAPSRPAGVP
jgi:high-affinity iron transporter